MKILLALALAALAADAARAETVVRVRDHAGRPIAGQPVTLYLTGYLGRFNLVLDNATTDADGYCTLRDTAYAGKQRCVVTAKPGWVFERCGKDGAGPCEPSPACATSLQPAYFLWGLPDLLSAL